VRNVIKVLSDFTANGTRSVKYIATQKTSDIVPRVCCRC